MKLEYILAAAAVYFIWKRQPAQALATVQQQAASDVGSIATVDVTNGLATFALNSVPTYNVPTISFSAGLGN